MSNISHCSAASIDPDSAESAKLAGYPIFDWLRFILASVVALGHASLITHSEITGNLAVQVFFSLSGWLIGGILLNSRFELARRDNFYSPQLGKMLATVAYALVLLGIVGGGFVVAK